MKLEGILPFARQLIENAAASGDSVIDATIGNGHDTLFLANIVGPSGIVFGFDIQEQSIINTKQRLKDHGFTEQICLYHKGHEEVSFCIPPEYHGNIKAAIFNLGYLPGGDKAIVTKPETTISAIDQLLELVAPEGIIVLVIYHGHQEGTVERDAVLQYVEKIDQKKAHVLKYQYINQQNNPPFIIAIEKR